MPDRYFNQALENFIKDFNYAGAIAHLTDRGYTLSMIKKRLGSNISDEYIKEQMIKFYKDRDILLTTKPGTGSREKIHMVRETSPYGKVSYRQVKETITDEGPPYARKKYNKDHHGSLFSFLSKKPGCYLSMTISEKELAQWASFLQEDQVDYLKPFLILGQEFYIRPDERLMDIVSVLYDQGCYRGFVWDPEARVRWRINRLIME